MSIKLMNHYFFKCAVALIMNVVEKTYSKSSKYWFKVVPESPT